MTALRDRHIWELTKVAFIRIVSQKAVPKSRQSLHNKIQRYIGHAKKEFLVELQKDVLASGKIPNDLFERMDIIKIATQIHRDEVIRAIQCGYKVPWETLKDYPDLNKSGARKATQNAEINK
jgi:hypothetical protein